MCGRFTLTYLDAHLLARELGVPPEQLQEQYRPRYNVAPTDEHPILRMKHEDREVRWAKWGLVNSWASDARRAASQINVRAETIESKPAFREAFERRRCVVPADGFFEWTGPRESRQPLWFHRRDGALLLFAGLHESWQVVAGAWQRTFAIVTTVPNGTLAAVHDRMPVILGPEEVDDWLNPTGRNPVRLKRLLVPAPDDLLLMTPVSMRVNSVKNDDASLLDYQPPLSA